MISELVLKYLNGECFVIRRGYETARPVSSSVCLTVPCRSLFRVEGRLNSVVKWEADIHYHSYADDLRVRLEIKERAVLCHSTEPRVRSLSTQGRYNLTMPQNSLQNIGFTQLIKFQMDLNRFASIHCSFERLLDVI